tara:strand:- start:315 stop:911 length:597 start_codon:yes stop_codon:yes gene_type:complete
MKEFVNNKINGWHYLGILIISLIFFQLLVDYLEMNEIDVMYKLLYVFPMFFIFQCFTAYRSKRVFGKDTLYFYLFMLFCFYCILIPYNLGDILAEKEKSLFYHQQIPTGDWEARKNMAIGRSFSIIYIVLFSCILIFKNAVNKTELKNKEKPNKVEPNNKSSDFNLMSENLFKLAELKEKGLLTEEEFNEQKKKLLNK